MSVKLSADRDSGYDYAVYAGYVAWRDLLLIAVSDSCSGFLGLCHARGHTRGGAGIPLSSLEFSPSESYMAPAFVSKARYKGAGVFNLNNRSLPYRLEPGRCGPHYLDIMIRSMRVLLEITGLLPVVIFAWGRGVGHAYFTRLKGRPFTRSAVAWKILHSKSEHSCPSPKFQ